MVSRDQIDVYRAIGDLFLKWAFGVSALCFFIAIMVKLIMNPSRELVGAQAVISATVAYCFRHYFPSTKSD